MSIHQPRRLSSAAIVIPFVAMLTACSNVAPNLEPDLTFTNDRGMAQIQHTSFEQLLIHPEKQFQQYRKIRIEPITVSYDDSKRLKTNVYLQDDEDFQFDERELEHFRDRFVSAFSKEWNKKMGWELTDEAGADVITVKADITDLYLFASIKNNDPVRRKTFARESSRMNIRIQLLDSVTGELLLDSNGNKVTGRGSFGPNNRLTLNDELNSVRYWSDAYIAFRQWANLLGTQIKATQTLQG